jgi:hypothetical protein
LKDENAAILRDAQQRAPHQDDGLGRSGALNREPGQAALRLDVAAALPFPIFGDEQGGCAGSPYAPNMGGSMKACPRKEMGQPIVVAWLAADDENIVSRAGRVYRLEKL